MFHLKGDHTEGWEVRAGDILAPVGRVSRTLDGLFSFKAESNFWWSAEALKEISMKLDYVNGRWPHGRAAEDDDIPF